MPDQYVRKGGHHLHVVETPQAETGALRVRMLGGFRVSADSHDVEHRAWRLHKSASLVKLLALQPRNRMHRDRVLDLLWPNSGFKKAANNLNQTLHEARKTLNPLVPTSGSGYLQLRDEHVILAPEVALWTDVDEFRAAATIARDTKYTKAYRRALELYSGELLPEDLYEEWTEDPRRELAELYLDLRLELATLHEEGGEYRLSTEVLENLVAEEPTNEEANAGLMRLYALTGRRRKALNQYEHYRRLAETRAGEAEAAPEIEALHEKILAGKLTPPETSPRRPSSSETLHPNNLPVSRTSFIGREREISEIKDLLERNRLLTLTGVGGAGKTRLALEVARELLGGYLDGVWMVGLASITDPVLVPQTVAKMFGIREQPHRSLEETLTTALRDKNLLLVLDNCEQVIDAAATLSGVLLDECPHLKILATSRELLGIEGEVNWAVPALSLPGSDVTHNFEDLQEAESMRLFADRASRRATTFSLTPENAGSVVEVCRKLDGIPLAIELAAARVGAMSIDQISARLGESLQLLSSGRRTAEPRQQTLRAALDWSHELLDDEERKVLRRLSVFAESFSLEAAEAIVAEGGIAEERVLDLVSSLVDKSLVVYRNGRHRLLEPVRQYARERLAQSGEEEAVRRRHALWCVELAEAAEPELTGPDQAGWMTRLEMEHANLRAALGWALDGGDAKLGLCLAGLLWLFWHTHGHSGEGRRWLESGIEEAGNGNARLKAKALNGAGWIAIFQRDYETSESLLTEGAVLYREIGDAEGLGACLSNIWFGVLLANREVEDYRWCVDEIEAIESQVTNGRTLANIALIRAIVKLRNKDLEEARSAYREARELYERAGDAQGTAMVLFNLATEALLRGDYVGIRKMCSESLKISRGQNDKLAIMYGLWILGCGMSGEGLHKRAARLWGAAEVVQEQNDMPPAPIAMNLCGYEDRLTRTRAALGKESLKTEWRRGGAMTQDEAINYAIAQETPDKIPLTPGETKVAELIARGMTNPEISTQLVVSERTVHSHVRNILKKLDLSSRSQVAEKFEQPETEPKPDDSPS